MRVLLFSCVLACAGLLDCSASQKQVESQVAVKVADDVCQVVGDQSGVDPNWVKILCTAGTNLIPVLLPKEQWYAIRMRTARDGGLPDAGPGL